MAYYKISPTYIVVFGIFVVGTVLFVGATDQQRTTWANGIQQAASMTVVQAQEVGNDFYISDYTIKALLDEVSQLRHANRVLQQEINEIRDKPKPLSRNKTHVLVVAGHKKYNPGAAFRDRTEYELNYDVMGYVTDSFRANDDYRVTTTHKNDGYNETFLDYFENNEQEILAYREDKKRLFGIEYPQGVTTNDTDHNVATSRGIIELYGINKWASENDVDMIVHVHFNDYPGRSHDERGSHNGFSIFVPLKTNKHFVDSFRFAKILEREMLKHVPRSSVKRESAGVLESELIAVGHANSVDVPVVLLEGGFVYEERFDDPRERRKTLQETAGSIYRAIDRYQEYYGK